MGLRIRDPEVHALARRIAALTGETMTEAVRAALAERLARLEKEQDVEARRRRIQAILDALPPAPPGFTSDHSDLYDGEGLPK